MSELFMILVFLAAAVVVVAKIEIAGILGFIVLMAFLLIVCDDVIVTTLPFMLVCCFAAKCKGSYNTFVSLWWVVIFIVFAFVFHFIYYRNQKDYSRGKSFWSILIVSIVVTLGGVGIITAKEYFAGVSLLYIFGLGFGILGSYWLMNASFKPSDKYDFSDRFAKIMVLTAVFGCFMILHHYIIHMDTFLANPRILQFQWRNNLSTMIMLTMPFAFYLSVKKTPYFLFGLFCYICLLLSGSRGGMMFGGIELLICIIVLIIVDKKKRNLNLSIIGTMVILGLVLVPDLKDLLAKTLERFASFKENKIRLGLFERAIEDFKSNPLFGRGLGYFGNRDIHKSVKGALCWYHSTPFQIIGSFGIAGIFAYLYQYFTRIKIFLCNRKSFFNISIIIAYCGVEMMSLVNPGVFSPVYLFIVTMFFVIIEKCSTQKDIDEYARIRVGGIEEVKSELQEEIKSELPEENKTELFESADESNKK
ncbi:MAG: O-antigen ligase family protein [Oscillospiraceae bacterium]